MFSWKVSCLCCFICCFCMCFFHLMLFLGLEEFPASKPDGHRRLLYSSPCNEGNWGRGANGDFSSLVWKVEGLQKPSTLISTMNLLDISGLSLSLSEDPRFHLSQVTASFSNLSKVTWNCLLFRRLTKVPSPSPTPTLGQNKG